MADQRQLVRAESIKWRLRSGPASGVAYNITNPTRTIVAMKCSFSSSSQCFCGSQVTLRALGGSAAQRVSYSRCLVVPTDDVSLSCAPGSSVLTCFACDLFRRCWAESRHRAEQHPAAHRKPDSGAALRHRSQSYLYRYILPECGERPAARDWGDAGFELA